MSVDNRSSISGIARDQQAVSVDGSHEGIFEPDGSLRPAERIATTGSEEPTSLEEWLEAVAPDRLARIDERVDELPTTRAELIEHHVRKILEETDEEGRTVALTPDLERPTLVITYHQRNRGPLVADSTGDDPDVRSMVDCLPELRRTGRDANRVEAVAISGRGGNADPSRHLRVHVARGRLSVALVLLVCGGHRHLPPPLQSGLLTARGRCAVGLSL